jgi:hypothetical protein
MGHTEASLLIYPIETQTKVNTRDKQSKETAGNKWQKLRFGTI